MERYQKIARRVAASEAVAASFFFQAKERPTDLFAGAFFDVRLQVKKVRDELEQKAAAHIEQTVKEALADKGVKVLDFKLSLGQYRGSRFVTSAKMSVSLKDEATAQKFLVYLQTAFSPKYKLKMFASETGQADYNVR